MWSCCSVCSGPSDEGLGKYLLFFCLYCQICCQISLVAEPVQSLVCRSEELPVKQTAQAHCLCTCPWNKMGYAQGWWDIGLIPLLGGSLLPCMACDNFAGRRFLIVEQSKWRVLPACYPFSKTRRWSRELWELGQHDLFIWEDYRTILDATTTSAW